MSETVSKRPPAVICLRGATIIRLSLTSFAPALDPRNAFVKILWFLLPWPKISNHHQIADEDIQTLMTLLDRLTNCCPRKSVPDCASKMCPYFELRIYKFSYWPRCWWWWWCRWWRRSRSVGPRLLTRRCGDSGHAPRHPPPSAQLFNSTALCALIWNWTTYCTVHCNMVHCNGERCSVVYSFTVAFEHCI